MSWIKTCHYLTTREVNTYGAGHINRYTYSSVGTAYNYNGYEGMAYYTNAACGYLTAGNSTRITTGCTSDYSRSEIKYVVDAWVKDKFLANSLKEDSLGYKARLIAREDLINNLGYNHAETGPSYMIMNHEYTPELVNVSDYCYWTMSPSDDDYWHVWIVTSDGVMRGENIGDGDGVFSGTIGVVRPVVTILKSAIK